MDTTGDNNGMNGGTLGNDETQEQLHELLSRLGEYAKLMRIFFTEYIDNANTLFRALSLLGNESHIPRVSHVSINDVEAEEDDAQQRGIASDSFLQAITKPNFRYKEDLWAWEQINEKKISRQYVQPEWEEKVRNNPNREFSENSDRIFRYIINKQKKWPAQ